jgi:hypothetical protein
MSNRFTSKNPSTSQGKRGRLRKKKKDQNWEQEADCCPVLNLTILIQPPLNKTKRYVRKIYFMLKIV